MLQKAYAMTTGSSSASATKNRHQRKDQAVARKRRLKQKERSELLKLETSLDNDAHFNKAEISILLRNHQQYGLELSLMSKEQREKFASMPITNLCSEWPEN